MYGDFPYSIPFQCPEIDGVNSRRRRPLFLFPWTALGGGGER
ncbi:hypothetical protein [Azospirillum argentinense]